MLDPISIVRTFQDKEDMPADGVAQVLLKEGCHAQLVPVPFHSSWTTCFVALSKPAGAT